MHRVGSSKKGSYNSVPDVQGLNMHVYVRLKLLLLQAVPLVLKPNVSKWSTCKFFAEMHSSDKFVANNLIDTVCSFDKSAWTKPQSLTYDGYIISEYYWVFLMMTTEQNCTGSAKGMTDYRERKSPKKQNTQELVFSEKRGTPLASLRNSYCTSVQN